MERNEKKVSAARLSIISNSALIVMKLTVGLSIGSVSVISEAAHSSVDLVAALIAFFSVKKSDKPADDEHPFGHGKIENISGTIEALLILLAAIWIIAEAIERLFNPAPLDAIEWGIGVMLISSVTNWFVSKRLFDVGRQTDSIALQADGWHLRTDVYTSLGVMASLVLIWSGKKVLPGIHLNWIDPVAAIAVAFLILHAAWNLTVQSAKDLLDWRLPAEEMDYITELIRSMHPPVHGFHKLRTRKAGSARFIEFHMLVDPDMTVDESHRLTDEITRLITEHLPGSTVTVHVEPCNGRCDHECTKGCMLTEEQRSTVIRKFSNKGHD